MTEEELESGKRSRPFSRPTDIPLDWLKKRIKKENVRFDRRTSFWIAEEEEKMLLLASGTGLSSPLILRRSWIDFTSARKTFLIADAGESVA